MNRRTKKKEQLKRMDAAQTDLLDRVSALEELTRCMTAEQTAQRELVEIVADDLALHQELDHLRRSRENEARRYHQRVRRERELERQHRRQEWAKLAALAAFAVAFLCFALAFPAPEPMGQPTQVQAAVAADPVERVAAAMVMCVEG